MLIIILTLLLGLFLSLTTLPLGYIAPEWLLLINIYWAIALPSSRKLILSFLSGFLVDIVFGQPLGITSLSYIIFIYVILHLYNSLRYMTITQQMVVLIILLIIKQHFFMWTCYIFTIEMNYNSLLISAVITGVLWPITYFSLRYVRRKFNINAS
tara:strand:+ start:1405 stop:1869 length:465 start_codon:yes stop_codon:yes gene_type:complete